MICCFLTVKLSGLNILSVIITTSHLIYLSEFLEKEKKYLTPFKKNICNIASPKFRASHYAATIFQVHSSYLTNR